MKQVRDLANFKRLDGLTTVNYTLLNVTRSNLYTKVTVKLTGPRTVAEAQHYITRRTDEYEHILNRTNKIA